MKTWAYSLAHGTGNSCPGGSCYLCKAGVKDRRKRAKGCPGMERGRLEKEPQGCLPTARLWVEEQTQIHKQNGILELRRERWGPPNPEAAHPSPAIPTPKRSLSPAIPTDLVRGIPFRREPGSFSGPGRPWRSNNDCGVREEHGSSGALEHPVLHPAPPILS